MVLVKMGEVILGAYYELPDGRIAITYSGDNRDKTVQYYFDDDEPPMTTSMDIVSSKWKLRRDLRDFPNARDPKLPYDFDLWWDIKTISKLRREIVGHKDEAHMRELAAAFQITI